MYTSETFPLKLPFSPFLLLTLISLTSTLSYGQEQIKTHWSFITPKPDMEEQLGKAYKDPPTGIFSSSQYIVLRVKSGDQVGRYAVATFDEDKASEESVSGYNKTLLPLIEEISRVVTVSRRDISTWRPGIGTCETSTGSYGYAEVVFFQLNSGGEQDFVFVQEKIREAAEKTNLPVLYEWQQVVSDVKSNFILILPRNQWADFRRLEKLFESMLIEVYGREDASSLLQRLNRSIRTRNSALWNFWAGHCLMRVGAGRPSDEMPQFPWPPPKWTSRYVVIEGLVATGKYEKLVNSFDRIVNAFHRAGISEWSVYGVGGNGFAMVSRMENIEDDGSPKSGSERWGVEPIHGERGFSLAQYLKALFSASPGRYRVIVLLVTDRSVTSGAEATSLPQWTRMLKEGAGSLPGKMREAVLPASARCEALVYEFYRPSEDDIPRSVESSHLQTVDHLVAAGLWKREELLP